MHKLEALEELRSRITSGRIPTGGHLVESELTAEFGLSRTPIRWVLRTLADEGLVVVEPNRGAFVAPWTTEDAEEVLQIRSLLEPHAAQLAARRRTGKQVELMLNLCETMETLQRKKPKNYRAQIAKLNHEFHLSILEAARSPRLYQAAKDLAQAPLMAGSFQYYSGSELDRSLQDHRLLVEFVNNGDGSAAKALMESHLRVAFSAVAQHQKSATEATAS